MDEYRIDDLARAAGMTVRNVRVYQDRGLLPPPRREGRVAWYSQAHLSRLRLVGRLLERGYAFAQISELVSALEQGRDLADVLGLEEVLTEPWSTEEPARLGFDDLRHLFGDQATKATVDRAVKIGVLERSRGGYVAPSPQILQAGVDLVAAGLPMPVVLDLSEALQHDLDQAAHRIVTTVVDSLLRPLGMGTIGDAELPEIARLVGQLRPHATKAITAMLARAMDGEVDTVLSGIAGQAAVEQRSPARRPSSRH